MSGWLQKYSINEAWMRVWRSFSSGDVVSNDEPGTVDGELIGVAASVSNLAELLNNSLPGKTPTVPDAIRASVAEAAAGTNDTKAVTPAGLAGAVGGFVEHGNIYVNDGTVVQDLSGSWLKPTGIFTADGISSDGVTPDYTTDQIDVDLPGTYLVTLSTSIEGELGYIMQGAVYLDGTIQPNLVFEQDIEVTGSVSASVAGTVNVTGSNMELEFYLKADTGTPEIKVVQASLQIIGIPAI